MNTGKLKVQSIEGKGRGIVAKRRIAKGETLEIAPYVRVSRNEARAIRGTLLTHYIFALKGGSRAIALGFGSLYNHSPESNADFSISEKSKAITFKAVRSIAPGEEVTINYGYDPLDPKTWDDELRAYARARNRK